jgi:hypothetical protein
MIIEGEWGGGGRRAGQREMEMIEIYANWILDTEHRKNRRVEVWRG